ncbi:hypothetical protein VCR3J2_420196 [Vibrio coralliirubri]|nr:hypothetical protein [Vibrio coralliirubri]CDT62763.1 hypothetical protein VCR26J2_290075 [Vibrio coralliirubri]CDT79719.1 hypothetical protein VCR12J2_1020169 [Vibrio coralliirubri]CDT97026.1 hypothetical protein VCR3J2_420196 [Vibrio coralliirubri]
MPRYRKRYYKPTQSKRNTIQVGLGADVYKQFRVESEELSELEARIARGFVIPKFIEKILPKFIVGTIVISVLMSLGSYSFDPVYVRFSWVLCIVFWIATFYIFDKLFVLLNPSLFRRKADLSDFLEEKRSELLAERKARPMGFQNLSLQAYLDIKSALDTPFKTTSKGSSCVYHIALDGWDLTQGYVGVSTSYFNRRNQHFRALRVGTHDNDKLQRAYNEYGSRLEMKILHNGISEYESYLLESRYRPELNMALNIRKGGR